MRESEESRKGVSQESLKPKLARHKVSGERVERPYELHLPLPSASRCHEVVFFQAWPYIQSHRTTFNNVYT